jgi:hypothetical protein
MRPELRLRQRYALCRVERYAHDRAAVVVVVVLVVMIADVCGKQSISCGSSLFI